jgi:hypothetical protein
VKARNLVLGLALLVAGASLWQQFGAGLLPSAGKGEPVKVAPPVPPPPSGGVVVKGNRILLLDGAGNPVMEWFLDSRGNVIIEINDHGTKRQINATDLSRSKWL